MVNKQETGFLHDFFFMLYLIDTKYFLGAASTNLMVTFALFSNRKLSKHSHLLNTVF